MVDTRLANDTDGINRRAVLMASGASLAISGGFVTTAAGGEDPPSGPSEGGPGRQPDLRIVDNSDSVAAVRVTYRYLEDDEPGKDGRQPSTPTIATRDHNTVGIHANRGAAATGELDIGPDDIANANATVERIRFEEPPAALEHGERRPFEVEVSHLGNSDTAEIGLGPDGAAEEETIGVHIRVDGSVSVSTTVSCP